MKETGEFTIIRAILGKNGTTVQYLFNKTETTRSDGLYFNANINLNFSGLPFSYDNGTFRITFPFNSNVGGQLISNGFFTVCIPRGFEFVSANQLAQIMAPVCHGAVQSIQFRLNQLSELIITYKNASPTIKVKSPDYHDLSFLLLSIGIPTMISSIALYSRQGRKK